MICALPSGIRRRRTISATVPTLWICSGCTSSISASRWATSTMRWRSSAIAALIAATDFSRPTPSGTTSFGKTTASRSGTRPLVESSSFRPSFWSSVSFRGSDGRGSRLTEYAYLEARAFVSVAFWSRIGSVRGLVIFGREVRQLAHQVLHQIGGVAHVKKELYACEVHATNLCQVPDHSYTLQVVIVVQADVRLGPDRFEQALFLVDPQRPRMTASEPSRDGDDVDGSVAACHELLYKTYQYRCQEICP